MKVEMAKIKMMKFIIANKLYQKFWIRRAYRKNFNKYRTKTKIVETFDFKQSGILEPKILFHELNLSKLRACSKSGSWKKNGINKIFNRNIPSWSSKNLPLFPNLNKLEKNIGFNTELIKAANLLKISKVEIYIRKRNNLSLNMYNGFIRNSNHPETHEEAFYVNVKGSESFQHFISETLPVIVIARKFLVNNPRIPIIIQKPIKNFSSQELIIRRLGIKNSLIYCEPGFQLSITNLYFIDFKPFNGLYIMPPNPYRDAHEIIEASYKFPQKSVKRKVVLFVRDEKLRNFANLQVIKNLVENFAKELDLEPVFLNPSLLGFSEVETILRSAKIVFGVHGGANYNMLFAPRSAIFVEFIPMKNSDSVEHLVLSFGQTYFPYAIPYSKGDKTVDISATDFSQIFTKLSEVIDSPG